MTIQFRCTNIVSYDAATESYVRCDNELTAPQDSVTKYVQCPKCNGRMLVPLALAASTASSPTLQTASTSTASSTTAARTANVDAAQGSLSFSPFGSRHRCSRCGGALDGNFRCMVCQYQNILTLDAASAPIKDIQPAGCQLWLGQKLSHGIGPNHLIMASHSLVIILLIILVTMAFGLGGSAAWIVLTIASVLGGLYAYVVFELRRIAHRPPAKLNWWQRACWRGVLGFYRLRKWRPLNSTLRWNVLDLRRQQLDDRTITSIPDIMNYHVLDLEGTQLTDAGFLRMQGMKQLQRLVVVGTKVTPDAVFQVQQRLPQVWIWS
jgi:hypothetical protein